MINLAPEHKRGLALPNPILLAAGTVGDGEARHKGLETAQLGGVVVGPVSRRSRGGPPPPRLAETTGGMVLDRGGQNRGIGAVMRKMARYWPRLGCPVLVQIRERYADDAARVAEALAGQEGLAGIELRLPLDIGENQVGPLVEAVTWAGDLPVLVKIPLDRPSLATSVLTAGADGIVVGEAPTGRLPALGVGKGANEWVTGSLYGPLTFAPMLDCLVQVVALAEGAPVVACGGIHTLAQVHQALGAGAVAVQIDSAAWVEPGLPARLVQQLAG